MAEIYDLWSDEDTSKARRSSIKKRNKRPLPHPGQSYNPDPEDHKRLLAKVAQREVKELHKKRELKKALKVDTSDEYVEESVFMPSTSTSEDESDIEEDPTDAPVKSKKGPKAKTKKQRLARLRDKLQRKAAWLRKLKNVRSSRFDAIKKILKKLDEKERARKALKRRKRLGYKLPDSDPIYCVSSELPSNLRETKCPLDALVREQLESFQSRLMVEPTKYQIKKRDKYKKRQYDRE